MMLVLVFALSHKKKCFVECRHALPDEPIHISRSTTVAFTPLLVAKIFTRFDESKIMQHFLYRTSCCVIELKNNNKIICFSQSQQYFVVYFNLLATSFGR